MAENDTHYNQSLYQNDTMMTQQNNSGEPGLTTPLPEFEEGPAAYPGDMNQPDMNQPGGGRPDMNQPGGGRPDMNQPGGGRPDMNRPGGGRPDMNRPGGGRPDMNRPGGSWPGANWPGISWPGDNWPGGNWQDGGTWFPIPITPSQPDFGQQSFGQVRFLNASSNNFPVNITIDGTAYAINSRFGTVSNYDWISDGFHTVTVRHASGLRSILLQQNFPFVAGQKVTMVLTDSASGGLEMIRVIDTGCRNLPNNSGCYRFANMTYSGSSFDLLLYGGETIFRNVGYQTVTSYKQAVAGSYQMYVTASNTYTFLTEIPIIMIGIIGGGSNVSQPLLSFTVDINAGRHYTTYLIGNTWSDIGLRAITLED